MSKVIIASDIRLYREGLSTALLLDGRFEVCATAADKEGVLRGIDRETPDALLLDMAMPEALLTIQTVAHHGSQTKVIALGMSEQPDAILSCAEAGVSGYVSREGSISDLINTLDCALRDELLCSPRVAALLLQQVSALSCQHSEDDYAHKLTPREREVVQLVAEGLSNKQIAQRLQISVSTAKNHVHNLFSKLKVRHRSEIMAISWRVGAHGLPRITENH